VKTLPDPQKQKTAQSSASNSAPQPQVDLAVRLAAADRTVALDRDLVAIGVLDCSRPDLIDHSARQVIGHCAILGALAEPARGPLDDGAAERNDLQVIGGPQVGASRAEQRIQRSLLKVRRVWKQRGGRRRLRADRAAACRQRSE